MPRKNLVRTDQYPYHIIIRSNNKEWFNLPMETMWNICIDSLKRANYKRPVKLESFVLMNNHYHMLLFTPNCDLDKFMHILNSTISKEIRLLTKRINRVFGDRYKWKIINSESYYQLVIRYIFQNPINAKLINKCENYPYSTLYYQIKNIPLGLNLPCEFKSSNFLNYINTQVSADEIKEISETLNKIGISHF